MFFAVAIGVPTIAGEAAKVPSIWGMPVQWAAKAHGSLPPPTARQRTRGRGTPLGSGLGVLRRNAARSPPGSVLWLRGGLYKGCFRCELKGTAEAHHRPRLPGRACDPELPGGGCRFGILLLAAGQYVSYWGFELEQTEKDLAEQPGRHLHQARRTVPEFHQHVHPQRRQQLARWAQSDLWQPLLQHRRQQHRIVSPHLPAEQRPPEPEPDRGQRYLQQLRFWHPCLCHPADSSAVF